MQETALQPIIWIIGGELLAYPYSIGLYANNDSHSQWISEIYWLCTSFERNPANIRTFKELHIIQNT